MRVVPRVSAAVAAATAKRFFSFIEFSKVELSCESQNATRPLEHNHWTDDARTTEISEICFGAIATAGGMSPREAGVEAVEDERKAGLPRAGSVGGGRGIDWIKDAEKL
jgi:hypothetical protein